ncbi:MAG TPA: hypothetical protein PK052_02320 [Anaerohalosphaeraceae bacterium]|nr:hypothetical protein [Anaerohalosphaeraceae bacterium]HOL30791.1 hypothetical protein [Anaerohalosphaeraceae bacterium]HOM76540.1 hypothetical protein [Anaerohalosphaeraceae bacterium]HPC63698.1 hypothetical protein [Anaerohalosphaeraceae bacterium]HPO69821.1 hypothetical protein [Anaerohalosphaeraceae bacterium]
MNKHKSEPMGVTDFFLELGLSDEIKAAAGSDPQLNRPIAFNSHIHLPPNFSAFETVQQAVDLAAQQEVRILGVGNYYDFSVYQKFMQAARRRGIFPLFGTEIIALETGLQKKGIRVNDPGNPGKYYICGKGISRFEQLSDRAAELLSIIRRNDALRMRQMTAKLAEAFSRQGVDTGLDEQAIIARVVRRHQCRPETVVLQERHLCQAFQERFFEKVPAAQRTAVLSALFGTAPKAQPEDAVGIQNEIRSHLMKAGKSCFVPEAFVSLAEAKELIAQLGGIACYPVLADGAKQRCEYETPVETLVETLKAENYRMVELIPIRNHPDVLIEYVTAIRQAGIAVVAGTEHNTLDLLPMEPACVNGQPIPETVKAIFQEGICVLAAHQFLSAHRQAGFDTAGGSPQQRIETFRKIGIAVLNRYFR